MKRNTKGFTLVELLAVIVILAIIALIATPIILGVIEDARKPWRYRMMVSMVDCIFADVATPDQARIIELNAFYFLKNNGGFVFSIKASCIDSTAEPEAVFASQIQELRKIFFKTRII